MPSSLKHRSTLCQLAAGSTGRICSLTGDENFCQRLREMGFGEAALVTKISGSTTSLCQINGTRIALSHSAAMNVHVELIPIKPALDRGPFPRPGVVDPRGC
jgi:ferrous iron transport protein A